jgi:hypothetical protein
MKKNAVIPTWAFPITPINSTNCDQARCSPEMGTKITGKSVGINVAKNSDVSRKFLLRTAITKHPPAGKTSFYIPIPTHCQGAGRGSFQ